MEKPYVMIMSAVSVDGKLTLKRGVPSYTFGPYVTQAVSEVHHNARAGVDAIMVGANTVVIDNPSLTVRSVEGTSPMRVVPDPDGVIPLESKILNDHKAKTVIAITIQTPEARVEALKEKGVLTVVCGDGKYVDLAILLKQLCELGVHRLMVEGGATLNWLMLSNKLVDEVTVFLMPVVAGGYQTTTFAESFIEQDVDKAIGLELKEIHQIGNVLQLTYKPV